jgi:predicted nuclease of predicted toxin-antitoxin system
VPLAFGRNSGTIAGTARLTCALADENFNNDIIPGLRRRLPDIGLLRVQDVGIAEVGDDVVLEWAADQNRVLLTDHAFQRILRGVSMPGVGGIRRSAAERKGHI